MFLIHLLNAERNSQDYLKMERNLNSPQFAILNESMLYHIGLTPLRSNSILLIGTNFARRGVYQSCFRGTPAAHCIIRIKNTKDFVVNLR